jgi:hypothetical protein
MIKEEITEAILRVYNKTLDPSLWDEQLHLDPEVRLALLKIGKDFYSGTDLKAPLVDIFFIGSSANYNWTLQSDIDVHVIIDISKEGINPIYSRKFMDGLGWAWNSDHDIEIKDHPIELYLQDQTESNGSPATFREGVAIYSLLRGQWIVHPNPEKIVIDKEKIKSKYASLKSQIETLSATEDYAGLNALMKKIKNYRNAGLQANGEFGTENLVFKALRHTGLLEKLKDSIKVSYDRMVHVDESTSINRPYIITGMTAQDLDVAGEKYYEGDSIITHGQLRMRYGNWAGTEDWRYRSDMNTIMWWGLPDEDERQATLDWLKKKYGISRPKEISAKATSDEMKYLLHYPWLKLRKSKLTESIDESKEYYVVGIATSNLNVVAKRYNKRSHYITHDQLYQQYGIDRDSGTDWRYHSQGNWIFWYNRPNPEVKEEVKKYLKIKFGVLNPKDEFPDTIVKGQLREVAGQPYLIVGLVNDDFQVVGVKDYGIGDAIGTHKIEHDDVEFRRQTRGKFSYNSPFSHWRYKSVTNTIFWWPGDPYNEDLKDVVLDYLQTKWNIKNPKINRNSENYFEDGHFILEMLCEAGEKDKIILGNVDDDLNVNSVKWFYPGNDSSSNHNGYGKRWRYRTTLPYVFWWDGGANTKEEEAVSFYLYEKFGIKVNKHKRFEDYRMDFSNPSYFLHGMGQKPKLEEEGFPHYPGILGNVDEYGNINSVKPIGENHRGEGKRWRYKFDAPQYVFWWEDPNEAEKEAVNNFIDRKYHLKVKRHRSSWDFSEDFQFALHNKNEPLPKDELMENMNETKFNPYKDKALQFVTYGGLSLTKQKGYDSEKVRVADLFHAPPARKGIYAFVWPYVEKFLLGGNKFVDPKERGKGQRGRIEYVKDKEGNVITTGHTEFEKHSDIQKNWSLTRKRDDASDKNFGDKDFEWDKEYYSILYRNANRKKFSYNGPLWHHLKDGVTQDKILDEKGAWIKTDMDTYRKALLKELHQMNTIKFRHHINTSLDHMEVFIDQKI